MQHPNTPNPPPFLDPSNIIREVGFKCLGCGEKYLTYEASSSQYTYITCPTCDCDRAGLRLEHDEELKLDIEVNEKRKRGETPKNVRDISHWRRSRGAGHPSTKQKKQAIVKPEINK